MGKMKLLSKVTTTQCHGLQFHLMLKDKQSNKLTAFKEFQCFLFLKLMVLKLPRMEEEMSLKVKLKENKQIRLPPGQPCEIACKLLKMITIRTYSSQLFSSKNEFIHQLHLFIF